MPRLARLTTTVLALGGLAAVLTLAPVQAAATHVLTLEYTASGVLLASTDDGTTIRTSTAPGVVISPGPYQVIVNNDVPDQRDIQHAFRLQGPGVNLQTDMAAGDDKTELFDVVLAPSSTYTFADDRQPNVPHVVFSTAASASAAAGSQTTPAGGSSTGTTSNTPVVGSDLKPLLFRGNLAASVAGGGKVTLTAGGTHVLKLVAGRYRVTVTDRTAKAGFVVKGAGKPAITLTGVPFVGKRTVTVLLRAGEWDFYSPTGKKTPFTVVS
jgi:hypothetical protein